MTPHRMQILADCGVTAAVLCGIFYWLNHLPEKPVGLIADWKLRGQQNTHSLSIIQLAYSPDGTKLACVNHPVHPSGMRVSYAGIPPAFLKILENESTQPYQHWYEISSIRVEDLRFQPIQFTSDSQRVEYGATESQKKASLVSWDIERQRLETTPLNEEEEWGWIPISVAGRVYAKSLENGQLQLVTMADHEILAQLKLPDLKLYGWRFSSEGEVLLARGVREWKTEKLLIANVSQCKIQCEFPVTSDHDILAATLSVDGILCSVPADKSAISVHNTATGEKVAEFSLRMERVWCAAFSPDNRLFAAGFESRKESDVVAIVWDVETGEAVNTIHDSNSFAVTAVAFSSDSQTLATGHPDGTIRFWSPATPEDLAPAQARPTPFFRVDRTTSR